MCVTCAIYDKCDCARPAVCSLEKRSISRLNIIIISATWNRVTLSNSVIISLNRKTISGTGRRSEHITCKMPRSVCLKLFSLSMQTQAKTTLKNVFWVTRQSVCRNLRTRLTVERQICEKRGGKACFWRPCHYLSLPRLCTEWACSCV